MARVIPVSLFLVTTMLADPLQGQTPATRPGQEAALVRQVFAAESSFAASASNSGAISLSCSSVQSAGLRPAVVLCNTSEPTI